MSLGRFFYTCFFHIANLGLAGEERRGGRVASFKTNPYSAPGLPDSQWQCSRILFNIKVFDQHAMQ